MTSKGAFQSKVFCDSVILFHFPADSTQQWEWSNLCHVSFQMVIKINSEMSQKMEVSMAGEQLHQRKLYM